MGRIRFREMAAAADNLTVIRGELQRNEDILEKLLPELYGTPEAVQAARRSQEILRTEISRLDALARCLRSAQREYQRAERQIADAFDLEDVMFPETQFGVSEFSELQRFEDLMPIRKQI